MRAITTFPPEAYDIYAQTFLETFVKHWEIPLTVYFEQLPMFRSPKVNWVDLTNIPKFENFRKKAPKEPESYLYDAGRFSCKAFAQLDAFKRYGGKIFWLDADIVTFQDVPKRLLYRLIKGTHLCYLGRQDSYSECGFVGFNCDHPNFQDFHSHYRSMYEQNKVYTLPYHTDCHAFDASREGKGRNLTPGGKGVEHVFCYSPIGRFCDHLKGPRKQLGFSPEHPRCNTDMPSLTSSSRN